MCPAADERLNLLLLPWPERIEPNAFTQANGRLGNMDPNNFGFFDYHPRDKLDARRLKKVLREAVRRGGKVHGVILPELAIDVRDIVRLERTLASMNVQMFVAGVRAQRRNYAHMGLYHSGRWRTFEQDKHHRWFLDRNQIHQYHLGAALHPRKKWWENIEIHRRSLNFVTANGWLTICHLICEDLARQEPVGELVRGVGPNLVIALLLDGPQLKTRWPARYASVLADDPGSSVLTLTSLGMATRSWSNDHAPSRVVALWKDSTGSAKEITLREGDSALLLTITASWIHEWAADGRSDDGNAAELVLSGVEPIRLGSRTKES
jgi:hypothetical protein